MSREAELPSCRLVLFALVVSCGSSIQHGYHMVLLNSAGFAVKPFVNSSFGSHYGRYLTEPELTSLWSVMTSSNTVGVMIGAILLPTAAEKLGRRGGIWFCAILSMFLAALNASCRYLNTLEVYGIGRLLMGATCGLALGLQSIYFTEITPRSCRGFISMMVGVTMCIAQTLAAMLGHKWLLGSENRWPYLHVVQLPVLLCPIALLIHCYKESPKMLLAEGKKDEAIKALKCFHPEGCIKQEIAEIDEELHVPRMKLLEALRHSNIRRAMLVGVVLSIGAGHSGAPAMLFYSAQVMVRLNIPEETAIYATIAMMGGKIFASVAAMFVIDRLGRRTQALAGLVLLLLSNVVALSLSLVIEKSPKVTSWASTLWMANAVVMVGTFSASVQPIALFITSELTPTNTRAIAKSVAMFARSASVFISGAVFLPLQYQVGGFAFLWFIVPLIFTTVFLYFMLPETKQRNYAEILEEWPHLPGGFCKESESEIEAVLDFQNRKLKTVSVDTLVSM